jgi:hypothetical protein
MKQASLYSSTDRAAGSGGWASDKRAILEKSQAVFLICLIANGAKADLAPVVSERHGDRVGVFRLVQERKCTVMCLAEDVLECNPTKNHLAYDAFRQFNVSVLLRLWVERDIFRSFL